MIRMEDPLKCSSKNAGPPTVKHRNLTSQDSKSGLQPSSFLLLVVRILLVAMPGAPSSNALVTSSFLFLVVRQEPLVASLLLVAMPFAPRSEHCSYQFDPSVGSD